MAFRDHRLARAGDGKVVRAVRSIRGCRACCAAAGRSMSVLTSSIAEQGTGTAASSRAARHPRAEGRRSARRASAIDGSWRALACGSGMRSLRDTGILTATLVARLLFKGAALIGALVLIVAIWFWDASLLTKAADENLRLVRAATRLLPG